MAKKVKRPPLTPAMRESREMGGAIKRSAGRPRKGPTTEYPGGFRVISEDDHDDC